MWSNPYLGASPDGFVGEEGLVEVKCLHSGQEEDLSEAVKDKQEGLCLEKSKNGKLQLKKHTITTFKSRVILICVNDNSVPLSYLPNRGNNT